MEDISKKLDALLATIQKDKESIGNRLGQIESKITGEVKSLRDDIKNYQNAIDESVNQLSARVESVESSQQFLNHQYEIFKNVVDKLQRRDMMREKENNQLKDKVKKLQSKLRSETSARNDLAQYQRRNMCKISGVPVQKDENSVDIVHKIARIAKIGNFDQKSVYLAHRITTKPDSPIIILFKTRDARENIYAQRRKFGCLYVEQIIGKSETFPDLSAKRSSNTRVFLNESLTPENKMLMKVARQKVPELDYHFMWSHRGNIFAGKEKDSRKNQIRRPEDLEKLVLQS